MPSWHGNLHYCIYSFITKHQCWQYAWSLLSVLKQYNVKDLLYEVFMPLEFYTSQKKKNLVTLLWNPKIVPSTFLLGGYCTLFPDMNDFKSRKPYSLVPCPCDAGTHTSASPHLTYSYPSMIPVQYIHISSKNCNCLCHAILFINFYHFYRLQIICSGILYFLHYLYILACKGWDLKPKIHV